MRQVHNVVISFNNLRNQRLNEKKHIQSKQQVKKKNRKKDERIQKLEKNLVAWTMN